VVLLVGGFEAAIGRIEAGLVEVGLVFEGDEDGDMVVAGGLLEDGVGLGEVVSFDAGDLFGEDDDLCSFSSENGNLGDVAANEGDGGGSLGRKVLVSGDNGDGDVGRGWGGGRSRIRRRRSRWRRRP